MTYKVMDSFYEPHVTTTLPRYAVYRKRKLFGWKYIGSSRSPDGDDIIDRDFESIPHNEGEWKMVTVAKPY